MGSTNSLATWYPSAIQREVAEYLAAGYSQNQTSFLVKGTSLRSINRWWTEIPEFRDYVEEVREAIRRNQRPIFQTTLALSQAIVLKALTGECDADDPRVLLAERVLARTLHRLAAVDHRLSAPDDDGDYAQLPSP